MSQENSSAPDGASDSEQTSEGAPDGGSAKDKGESSDERITRLEREASDAIKRRDEALRKLDRAQAEIKTLKAQTSGDDKPGEKDSEKLRKTFELEREELIKRAEAAEARTRKHLLRDSVIRQLDEICTDGELAYMVLEDKFELADEDTDHPYARPKAYGYSSVNEFAERELPKLGKLILLKSNRKPGTGASPAPATGSFDVSSVKTIEDVTRLPSEQQRAVFQSNPALARQIGKTF